VVGSALVATREKGIFTVVAAAVAALALSSPALADEPPAKQPSAIYDYRGKRIAVVPFDALGLDEERVLKLEALFRNELERFSGVRGPTRRQVAKVAKNRRYARCSGETRCLAAIGKKLGVELAIAGNVAALGDSYVVNIKAIDVKSRSEINRVASDPLKGSPDELIEAVRVAAYRLLAPDRLIGALSLLADVNGASVALDGKPIGTTPLSKPVSKLSLGKHKISVTKDGYSTFAREVDVRFQKTTRVVVRLAAAEPVKDSVATPLAPLVTPNQKYKPAWYESGWFIAGVAVVALSTGAIVGWQLGKDEIIDCREGGCGP